MDETSAGQARARTAVPLYPVLLLALVAGLGYWVGARFFDPFAPAMIAWKGAGVGLLAIWAGLQARSPDGWLIAIVLALGAAGDVLLDAAGAYPGVAAFLAGHLVAIVLYLRNRRPKLSVSQLLLAIVLVPVVVFVTWSMPENRAIAPPMSLYALALSLMAATAWTSRFPRYLTGLGAMLFVASDLLIFARYGPLAASAIPGLLIWPLYFTGQAMIATGVVRTLQATPRAA